MGDVAHGAGLELARGCGDPPERSRAGSSCCRTLAPRPREVRMGAAREAVPGYAALVAYRDELEAAHALIAQLEGELVRRGGSTRDDAATLRVERDAALRRIEALELRTRELEATVCALRVDHEASLARSRDDMESERVRADAAIEIERGQARAEVQSLRARIHALQDALTVARGSR